MRYIQLMQTTHFVVFQLANFFLFFFSGKYLIGMLFQPALKLGPECTLAHTTHAGL